MRCPTPNPQRTFYTLLFLSLTFMGTSLHAQAHNKPGAALTCHFKENLLRQEFHDIMHNDKLTQAQAEAQTESFKDRLEILCDCPPVHINRLTNDMAKAVRKDMDKLMSEQAKTQKKMDKRPKGNP